MHLTQSKSLEITIKIIPWENRLSRNLLETKGFLSFVYPIQNIDIDLFQNINTFHKMRNPSKPSTVNWKSCVDTITTETFSRLFFLQRFFTYFPFLQTRRMKCEFCDKFCAVTFENISNIRNYKCVNYFKR